VKPSNVKVQAHALVCDLGIALGGVTAILHMGG